MEGKTSTFDFGCLLVDEDSIKSKYTKKISRHPSVQVKLPPLPKRSRTPAQQKACDVADSRKQLPLPASKPKLHEKIAEIAVASASTEEEEGEEEVTVQE